MSRNVLYRLVAGLYISFVFLTSAVFFPAALIIWLCTRPFDKRLRALHQFTCLWASFYIWLFPPWTVTIHGRDKVDNDRTCVIVSNHQSVVDILVTFTLFLHFKWVSKSELFLIPFIGWNMVLNDYIKLKRGNKGSIKKMYEACEAHLRQGSSVYMFPEGTRSATGELRDFKEGAFVLAKRLGIPILPIVISGTSDAVPKNSLSYNGKSNIQLHILDEISPESFANQSPRELATRVQEQIRQYLPESGTAKGAQFS